MLLKCIFRLSPPAQEQQAKSGLRPRSCAQHTQGPFRRQRLRLFFFCVIEWPGYTYISASCVNCHNLLATYSFTKQLWIFQPLPPRLPSKRLWSGNVCQITNKWEKQLSGCTLRVHWNVLSGLCDTQCSATTRMCLWCGKGIKNSCLPSLHQECVPPDFGFPVGFESGKRKRTKLREFIWPVHSPSAPCTACQVLSLSTLCWLQ